MNPNQNQPQNQQSIASSGGVSSILIILLILTLIATGGLYFLISKNSQAPQVTDEEISAPLPTFPAELQVSPSPTPSPKPIAHGKSGFLISLGSNVKGPRMGKLDIDPYDPAVNSQQKITIEVVDKDNPVSKVYAILQTDNKTSPRHELKLVSGTTTSGNWEGNWTVQDTYLYNYVLTLEAVSLSGTSSVNITLR